MATVAAQIEHPNITPVFLVEQTVGVWVRNWTLTSGKTVTYEADLTDFGLDASNDYSVVSVSEDGSALTSRASTTDVENNPGSYYKTGDTIYVSSASGTPYDNTIVLRVKLYFSNLRKMFNDIYYEPRVRSVPNLSLRIEKDFGDVTQIGGGDMALENLDGWFDSKAGLEWENGTVSIKLGIDRPDDEMAYGDYTAIGTWIVESWARTDQQFKLRLKEIKSRLRKEIPITEYTRTSYPNANQDAIGEPLQLAYGRIYGAKPQVIDSTIQKFKVANHAIRDFVGVRVYKDDKWTAVSFASTDKTLGEFTLSSANWSSGEDVSVDFIGKENPDGTLMDNPIDVIEDILTHIGETDLNSSSFSTAVARLEMGTDSNGEVVVRRPVSLYLNEKRDALEVIGEINMMAGTYLFSDASGQWKAGTFAPEQGEGLDELGSIDYADISEEYDGQSRVSKVTVNYAYREQDEYAQVYSLERASNQYIGTDLSAIVEEYDIATSEYRAAQFFAQRQLLMHGKPARFWTIKVPYRGLTKEPGDQIRLTNTRTGLDVVAEILENRTSFGGAIPTSTLLCGELHNYAANTGFWVADSATLATRLADETGYSSGADEWSSSWSSTIKTWAKQNRGYWTDDNGFADSSDPDSHLVSVWT